MPRRLAGFWRVLLATSLVVLGGTLLSPQVVAQQGGTNLLVNADFEWGSANNRTWPFQDAIPEVQVCPGWRAFYVDKAPAKASATTYWRRPEFRDVKASDYPNRVRTGLRAAKYFSFGGQHEAGFYQQVGGIEPGTALRFAAFMETWSCLPGQTWNVCPTGDKSNSPADMHTKIGIDPTGGTNPWSASVVWSPEIDAYDAWTYFQVEAVAEYITVTVFTYSWADWTDERFRINNDVYLDDASLIALEQAPATAVPEAVETPDTESAAVDAAVAVPAQAPVATSTPHPDGTIIHVVQPDDTFYAIALLYDISPERLVQLNGLTDINMLSIGQELLISAPESPAAPAAESTPLSPATAEPTWAEPVMATPTPATISSGAMALPASTTATIVPSSAPTSETKKASMPWGLVGSIGLLLGFGLGFIVGKMRR
jgi:LysM repeat protein